MLWELPKLVGSLQRERNFHARGFDGVKVPASTMPDHLRTLRAPLIPAPRLAQASPAAVRSPVNFQKYIA